MSRFELGVVAGSVLILISMVGFFITLAGWLSFATGPGSCNFPPCPVPEIDPNNAVLVIAGPLVSLAFFALGAVFVLGSNLLRPSPAPYSSAAYLLPLPTPVDRGPSYQGGA
ncbi:MAG: hypothetical protein WA688_06180 [Thermoplasmata archaeon]